MKLAIDLGIGKTQDKKPLLHQIRRSFCISGDALRLIMLAAVYLYDKTCSVAIEVNNISAYGFLPLKPHRITGKKVIP